MVNKNTTAGRPMFKQSRRDFSRKHSTPAAHEAAQHERMVKKSRQAFESLRRFEDVELDLPINPRVPIAERKANARTRLRALDQRLGDGVGAAKERKALRDILAI